MRGILQSLFDYSFSDKVGRIVLITCVLNSLKLSLVNIYAPNSQSEQLEFLQNLNNCLIDKSEISTLIVGGDWNCTLSKMDKTGGTIWKPTNYRNLVLTTMDAFDLVDIQRLRHPRLSTRVKGNSFRRTIYSLSLIVIALTVLKFFGGGGGISPSSFPPVRQTQTL